MAKVPGQAMMLNLSIFLKYLSVYIWNFKLRTFLLTTDIASWFNRLCLRSLTDPAKLILAIFEEFLPCDNYADRVIAMVIVMWHLVLGAIFNQET